MKHNINKTKQRVASEKKETSQSSNWSFKVIKDTVIISKLSQIKFEYLSSKLIYVNSGATRPRTPRCFQVLDYPVLPMGSTMKFGIY